MRRQLAILGLAAVTTFWLIALVSSPRWATPDSRIGSVTSALVYVAGSIVCHQRPERSFHYNGAQLPVCARCTGLYAGAMTGVVAFAVTLGLRRTPRSPTKRFTTLHVIRIGLVVAAMPTTISLVTEWAGWWAPDNTARAILGVPLGAVVGACVAAVGAGDLE